ncbi:hypothetical protein K502DRAFT_362464 [Neoconidiobolus thromboides FSU 785]|nr:hypothetical protein K502DRAFT_362464 [Neoconidiobolus thromboides FSU 785]
MDTSWCTICGQHIDYSDTELYCSERCRKRDEIPLLLPSTFTITFPGCPDPPSPTSTYSLLSIENSVEVPYFQLNYIDENRDSGFNNDYNLAKQRRYMRTHLIRAFLKILIIKNNPNYLPNSNLQL